ncbi:hypothetical protein AMES_6334 [Amycolatopsis mediterranei S699]|uniref:Pepco domain-containing protein n=1 Tax=Amycolatopsis mediterranei (strain U-32) TaxID=749927 RepID=A0A0H3DEV2_AMYMU|nr:hypothetical protein AMED_6427 [Amycolatopsis mediterranei U32]AFO79870.1 hypothetical protein AMES_6334 [Amycolatopsis mediterranei S699]AGT86998.1 hypothetical protein B737_6334 [Amycolatopsis mediterranei RB]KDO10644.1 hypothetical protein DV26_12195 [Amycolatopsis mediterranei]KDU87105.1 hypothetical protein DV36_37945 [Amycolatopsis mediterranei]
MTVASGDGIPILWTEPAVDGEKGLFSTARQVAGRIGELDSEELAQNLSAVCSRLASAFRRAAEASEMFELDAFEVNLDLTAKGEVRLVGSFSSEIKGGVKLVFRRTEGTRT